MEEYSQEIKVHCLGPKDILTQALGTPEQHGKLRAMGQFITPRKVLENGTCFNNA